VQEPRRQGLTDVTHWRLGASRPWSIGPGTTRCRSPRRC